MPKNSAPARPALNDIVHCIFKDHAQDSKKALRFETFGRLTRITKDEYVIEFWRYVDDIDRASDSNRRHNEDGYAIVRKAVESIRVLK
jgi:hypothetical protein